MLNYVVFEVMFCVAMREFIGNPNKDEYYEEDDVESEIFYDGADNFIYLDPNDMGIEIDDDDDEEEEEEDEDFESLSLGDHFSSEDDDDYIDDEDEEESLSVEGMWVYSKNCDVIYFLL